MHLHRLASALLFAAACGPALGQYKWIGPDGTVTYGDRPPTADARKLNTGGRGAAPASVGNSDLPYALRGPVARHPVTLYAAAGCEPCSQLRDHLTKRGVPFSERQLRTPADIDAFKKLGFADNLMPALTVGRQRLTGYEPTGVDALLDAAGYPKKSILSKSWRPSPAEDLSATAATAATAAAADADGPSTAAGDGRARADAAAAPAAGTAAAAAAGAAGSTGNRLIIPEGPKPVKAAPPLPARSGNPEGVRF